MKTIFEQNLENAFELTEEKTKELTISSKEMEILPKKTDKKNIEEDYEYARKNIRETIEQGLDVAFELQNLSKNSQAPRAYEVYVNLMKALVESNKGLIDLHKQKREIDSVDQSSSNEVKTINNTMFVGSTKELQNLIKNSRS